MHAAQDRHPGCQDHYGCGKALAQDFATLICLHLLGPAVVPSYVVCVEAAGFDQAMKIEDALRKIRLLRRIIPENGASGFRGRNRGSPGPSPHGAIFYSGKRTFTSLRRRVVE